MTKHTDSLYLAMHGLIRVTAVLAIVHRFRTPSLEFKCLGTSFGGQKQTF